MHCIHMVSTIALALVVSPQTQLELSCSTDVTGAYVLCRL